MKIKTKISHEDGLLTNKGALKIFQEALSDVSEKLTYFKFENGEVVCEFETVVDDDK